MLRIEDNARAFILQPYFYFTTEDIKSVNTSFSKVPESKWVKIKNLLYKLSLDTYSAESGSAKEAFDNKIVKIVNKVFRVNKDSDFI